MRLAATISLLVLLAPAQAHAGPWSKSWGEVYVKLGESLFFGSSADGKVYAMDVRTGRVRWSVRTGGPVRLAPTVWRDRVYVGSDDGWVYCLNAADGSVRWRFHAAPSDQQLLGHGRMISLWPVRTGVLVDQGKAYFAAGVFPAEGLYLYCVDAETGKVIWRNDAFAQGGRGEVSPQGYMLASLEKLFLPSGRGIPGVFNRADGRGLYQSKLSWRREGLYGGTQASLNGPYMYNGTERILAYQQKDGKLDHVYEGRRLVFSEDRAKRGRWWSETHLEWREAGREPVPICLTTGGNAYEEGWIFVSPLGNGVLCTGKVIVSGTSVWASCHGPSRTS